ncbi:MAG: hypothetical protein Q9166_000966 [cf. Caloplaca sp. 2 TL-2023]
MPTHVDVWGPPPTTIENWLYKNDEYRVSSSSNTYSPLPWKLRPAPAHVRGQIFRLDSPVRAALLADLSKYGIQHKSMQPLIQSKPEYPDDIEQLALHIVVDAQDKQSTLRWQEASQTMEQTLRDHDLYNMTVEIQDPERTYQPSWFPIQSGHKAVPFYESIRSELLKCVYDVLELDWELMCLFEVGRTYASRQATVVILVRPFATGHWPTLIDNLQYIIKTAMASQSIKKSTLPIEISPGNWSELPPVPTERPGQSFWIETGDPPRYGTSIGVRGEQGGGSLGGFFTMKGPTRNHTGFLTNSHVVVPPSTANASAISQYNWYGLPYGSKDNPAARTEVQYFAVKDCVASINDGQRQIESLQSQLCELTRTEQRDAERGVVLPSHRQNRVNATKTRLQQEINSGLAKYVRAKQLPKKLGTTVLASGRRVTEDLKTLDYAFVECSRLGSCVPPSQENFEAAKAAPSHFGLDLALTLPPKYHAFSNIQKDKWYYKNGRTTGLTGGICNGVDAWIRPTEPHTLFDAALNVRKTQKYNRACEYDAETGKPVYTDNKEEVKEPQQYYYAREWVILNAQIQAGQISFQKEFCDQGDSGSLVANHRGEVAGLLWGSITGYVGPPGGQSRYTGVGMVSDIDDVKNSIRTDLGWPRGSQVEVLEFP